MSATTPTHGMADPINYFVGLPALFCRSVVPINIGDIQLEEELVYAPPAAPEQQIPSAPVAYELDS